MKKKIVLRGNNQSGFSLPELLLVFVVIAILSAISLSFLSKQKQLYKPDDQALKIVDILQEARQRSLTERETMRVEISLTRVRLIDENGITSETDDLLLKEMPLLPATDVNIESRPAEINNNPPESITAPSAQYTTSVYPSSANQKVCTLRFQSNGRVVNAGNSPVGNGATVSSVTIHNWSPKKESPERSSIARAITVIGTSGVIRLWEYRRDSPGTNKWFDSRR